MRERKRIYFKIKGKHKTKGDEAKCYGEFDVSEMYQCMKHLNTLKTGTVGNTIGFWVEKYYGDELVEIIGKKVV